MIRLVRDFVPIPSLFLLCDIGTCGNMASALVDPNVPLQESLTNFVNSVSSNGWVINLMGSMCPEHVKKQSTPSKVILAPSGLLFPN